MASRTVRFISGADQMVICPYDHHHVIHSRNLGKHIRKCRKNYTGPELAVCAFSAVHIMPPQELLAHQASCPYAKYDVYAAAPE
ncbi:PREDICTED: protein D7-like [Branchiostoma belcheri]|uniref:Protein D7-like n=1 Tax=Branchiostoma belcheri TaxID=7741 RepID=A0A6P4YA98_BRABE|nr:PREDICTED: protein D7-like [Branchiostoma belcheri]